MLWIVLYGQHVNIEFYWINYVHAYIHSSSAHLVSPSTADRDYTAITTNEMFPPANSSQQLCVAILLQQDMAVENNETFSIQLTTEDSQVTVSPEANSSTVTILDDDGM